RGMFLIAESFRAKANLYKPLQGEAHKWDLRRAMEICDSAKLRFKDSEGAILCENLQHDIQTKSLTAVIEEHNLPQQAFRGLVRYRNFTDLHYRIVKITRDEVTSQRQKWERNYNVDVQQKFISYFLSKQPVTKGNFTLPNDNDYQEHSLEVKLDALPAGEYMILYSNRADFSAEHNCIAYAFTTISGISFIHRNSKDGGTDGFVVGRDKGEPLAGATINVFAVNYNYKKNFYEPLKVGTFTSDAKGYFRVPYMKKENQRSFYFEFLYKGDKNSTQPIDQNRYYGGSVGQYKQEDQHAYTRTYFFLDRSIYRPGQTIFFKGLVVSTDGKTSSILPGHKTKLTLYDVNSQVKGEIDVTTNEYGTYSGSFTAPSNGLTGEMHLQDSENTGTAPFSVEEYKRPKFEIVFDTLKGSFKLNDTIEATGKATAYSGASIDGAVVKYRVVRIARFPYWWWYRWGYYPTSPQMEITQGETKTDAEGKFTIAFAAVPDPTIPKESEPTFAYTIYADVTDINGETHSNTSTVSVGYTSLELSIPITNINVEELKGNAKEVALVTTNLAGMFEATTGNIEIFQLKVPSRPFRKRLWDQPDRALYTRQQYYQLFSSDLFDDEDNKYKWEHEKRVLATAFNTGEKKTFSIPDLKQWTPGEYVLEATALDKSGQQVKAVTYFTVYAPHDKKVPAQQINYFQAIKEVAEPGELASFVAGSAEKDVRVLYEVEQDGQVISSQWINLSNEQRYFEIAIKESYRGNIGIHWTFVKNNRLYTYDQTVTVPFTNKALDISFETFRDKLQPGQQEQWKILVKGKKADEVMAEMVASLYDESLDTFRPHAWYTELFGSSPLILQWQSINGFDPAEMVRYDVSWNTSNERSPDEADYDELDWFEYSFYDHYRPLRSRAGGGKMKSMAKESFGELVLEEAAAPQAVMDKAEGEKDMERKAPANQVNQNANVATKPDVDLQQVAARKNFNETAFFYPHLQTNDKGEIVIDFTIPEALTRWKMLGFAHTKDLKSAMITKSLITQKELMVVPNQPRFFREGDKMTFAVKVSSLVDTPLTGQAQLEFFDPFTSKPVAVFAKNANNRLSFSLAARQSTNLEWSIEIPEGLQALSYKVVAKAGNFSDGEEMTLPVLTNRMLVTETLPLPIRGKQSKDFQFKRLADNGSPTLRPHRFTLEFTSNPAWYAVQALPYMMEYPYDCVEQTFSKFYANSIASHIANSNPRIRQVFDTWKNIQPDALLSNLEKNQELKSALLEETPWVLQANNETERKRNVGLLFDLNKMANERDAALEKVIKAQRSNGGFSWFPGFPEDRYMTQHIVSGLGHLDALGIQSVRQDAKTFDMLTRAIRYLDNQIQDDYDQLKARARKKEIKLEDKHIGSLQIHYLYARSNFKDNQISAEHQEAFQYYLTQAKKYWLNGNLYLEGMTCLALHRFADNETTAAMIKSFKERSLQSDEMGMYWKSETGYYWYQAPIETQALMIEVFDEVAHDAKAVEELKVWLLKQKQTQDWKTTKATAEACYALLRRGLDILSNTAVVDITVGKEKIDPSKRPDSRVEAGTGYFKTAWQANEISASMGNIHVEKRDEGVAWGAAYYQYFEQLDKITTAETPLRIKKELFNESNTATG
ncbi:MAG TPA: alpha-2-macroglobulin family protein, partial [Chryseolinea sp.]|nr:alpha-2-macroglobulin family protein [Chryseolinea sp.]